MVTIPCKTKIVLTFELGLNQSNYIVLPLQVEYQLTQKLHCHWSCTKIHIEHLWSYVNISQVEKVTLNNIWSLSMVDINIFVNSFHAIPMSITQSRLRQKRAGISTFPNKQCGFKFQFSSCTPIFAKFRRKLRNSRVFSYNCDEYYGIAITSITSRNFNISE